MTFMGAILENYHMIDIPTDSQELATMLDTYAQDWGIVLAFLSRLARSRGIFIDTNAVSKIIMDKYYEEERWSLVNEQ